MRISGFFVLLASMILMISGSHQSHAQNGTAEQVKQDIKSSPYLQNSEMTVRAFFDAISDASDEKKSGLGKFDLFTANARIIPSMFYDGMEPEVVQFNPSINPVLFWMMNEQSGQSIGVEHEVLFLRSDQSGFASSVIATIESNYEDSDHPDHGKRSIVFIQLMKMPAGWQISQLIFQEESDDFKIPEIYLPNN